MKKTIGTILTIAAIPMMCTGGKYEIIIKLIAAAMFIGGAILADFFDDEEKKSEIRIAHDDGEYKMPEE